MDNSSTYFKSTNMQKWFRAVPYLNSPETQNLFNKIQNLRQTKTIFPTQDQIFNALECLAPEDVKVIILGQDPYHGQGQSHGLAFSVLPPCPIPPSLRNIFKEIQRDIYNNIPLHNPSTDLTRWTNQGLLLLNTVLSVEESKPKSHAKFGWQKVTYAILEYLAKQDKPLAVLLWGNDAKEYATLFQSKHYVLTTTHPSPLSASRGFLGCGHFSKVNAWLMEQGIESIEW